VPIFAIGFTDFQIVSVKPSDNSAQPTKRSRHRKTTIWGTIAGIAGIVSGALISAGLAASSPFVIAASVIAGVATVMTGKSAADASDVKEN
jgi:hypothetical protein